MKTRVLTGAILGLVLIPIFVLGGLTLEILLGVFVLGSTYELFKMYNTNKTGNISILIIEMIMSLLVYLSVILYFIDPENLELVFLAVMFDVIVAAILLIIYEEYTADDFGRFLVSTLYASFGFAALYGLRLFGLEIIGFLFAITIFTDTFAYIFGVNFGKTKIAPKISPKKSVEGSVGGGLSALVLVYLYIVIFDVEAIGSIELNVFVIIVLVLFLSTIGQIGDLIASKLKRAYGIKDYSNLFPGHGGIMDRFDSAIFAALLLMFIEKVVEVL